MTQCFDEERSRHVAKAISHVIAQALSADVAGVVSLLDSCREQLLGESRNDSERLEITRRIAEAKVSILFKRRDAMSEFNAAWRELEAAGYSSHEREASMLFYFIKFRMRVGGSDDHEKQQALDRLSGTIDRMLASGETKLAAHFQTLHQQLSGSNE